ncbi:MAG: hypothetical protein KZQ78_00295 [Candidatus Thiodiazotropha sp. (ex Ustalcina ferruginea)]|nr:hypothetical protein [Candidatus Thiodiazotropha sp. (ex Ustalcina ferruginea)]
MLQAFIEPLSILLLMVNSGARFSDTIGELSETSFSILALTAILGYHD